MNPNVQTPLKDICAEANRVATALEHASVSLRLLGGAAVWLRCPSARSDLLHREYADLDFIGLSSQTGEIKQFLVSLGYEADKFFNSLHGRSRLLFHDTVNGRQVDILLNEMEMCHRLDFRSRIKVDAQTLPLADLLLTKLQIVQINAKDLTDLITLLGDHPVGDSDGESINGRYIAQLTSGDWGLYRTIQLNLEKVNEFATHFAQVGPFAINEQVKLLQNMMDSQRKSLKWKVRAQVGDRVQWYELPEEVRRD